ncbi:MFS transporter [Nocardiopsis dassonvillei]|jgi:MFS family permease|uniref:MFS transporter n=1 Tax=Nocardiopsis dassonvillei TaxID=2014 RepID=UPI00102BB4A6|nr:MFS transporter [Nocardiopsis dassonvillei]MCP3012220.1 MFS transporter [Nocardiopsis dassonvillei]
MNTVLRSTGSPQAIGALAVLCLAQFLIALDYSIIYVAMPSVGVDLGLSSSVLQWIVSAYALLFAGLLLVGGRVCDRVGAKRVFLVSVVVFGAASALGGFAQEGVALLVSRGVQGLSAAFLQPATIGLISATFAAGPARSRALSVWGAIGASGLAVGAILGGVLTEVSWRWTFLINIPLTLLAALGGLLWLAASSQRERGARVPLSASMMGTGALLALVVGLTLVADTEASGLYVGGACLVAVVLGLAFIANEMKSDNVMVDRSLRRTRSLGAGVVATYLYMASVGSEFYLVTLLLQELEGFTPLQAGLGFLPLAVMVTLGNMAAGRAVERVGAGTTMTAGFLISFIGLALLAAMLGSGTYATHLVPGLLLSGFGHGVIYTSMFVIGTRDVPDRHQSTAGALMTTSQYLSAAVTVALLTIILGTDPTATEFRWAFVLTAVFAVAGMLISPLLLRRPEGKRAAEARR